MSLNYEPASEPLHIFGLIPPASVLALSCAMVQGYLTYKKTHPPRALQ